MARHLAVILLALAALTLGVGLRSEDVRIVGEKAREVVQLLAGDSQDAAGLRPTATPTPGS